MSQSFDTSRSLTAFEQDSTLVAVVEMSQSKWLVAAVLPGVERRPLKKLDADADALLKLLQRWCGEARKAGRTIGRIVCAYEAGRDGFWLARWLQAQAIEAYVIHAASIAVSREHRRAKSDRIDTELLMRSLLGWLRGEKRHCSMVAIPTIAEEDARRPSRERDSLTGEQTRIANRFKAVLALFGIGRFNPRLRKAAQKLETLRTVEGTPLPENAHAELRRDLERLRLVRDQIRAIESERLRQLAAVPAAATGPHAMVRLIAKVFGVGIETADLLVNEALARKLRDRRAVARYAGLTGAPDESGKRRREKGLARAGNSRVRRGMIQLAWRFLIFQKDSRLARWFRERTADGRSTTRKTMIVALARKLLIALWRLVTTGEMTEGIKLRPATA
jgi:transposase